MPAAVDFAVTSGLRTDRIGAQEVFSAYEAKKNLDRDTAAKCAAQGVQFWPAVFEGHGGGWAGGAAQLVNHLVVAQKAKGFWVPEGIRARVSLAAHFHFSA